MSVRTMARVWSDSAQSGSHLLMLLAIADFADDDGRAYPSVAGLAVKCRMKVRNANYVLADLQASGELRVKTNQGPRGTNLYQLVLGSSSAPNITKPLQAGAGMQSAAPLQSSAQTPATECAKPLQAAADEPSLNHHEPSKVVGAARKKRSPTETKNDVEFLVAAGCDRQHAEDWLKVRKAKRAAFTQTAWADLCSEAEKAGITPGEAVAICAKRSWQGFDSSWEWRRGSSHGNAAPAETAYQRTQRERAERMTGGLVSAKPPGSRSQAQEVFDVTP
ncbi:MAG TPA: helix-turn-helix domain-containing protein [Burkholderiaceae bacterium]|jgi:hypothetical protein